MKKTYIFQVEIEQEEDGRWSAEVPALPGCATWGHTKEEALKSIQEATELYIASLVEHGLGTRWLYPRSGRHHTRLGLL